MVPCAAKRRSVAVKLFVGLVFRLEVLNVSLLLVTAGCRDGSKTFLFIVELPSFVNLSLALEHENRQKLLPVMNT